MVAGAVVDRKMVDSLVWFRGSMRVVDEVQVDVEVVEEGGVVAEE